LTDLPEKQLNRFIRNVARTRWQISKHFFDNLHIPAAPCLDILFALQATDGAQLDVESLSGYIFCSSTITVRYLNLMAGKGLVEVDDGDVTLTPEGDRELSNILSQFYDDFND
tara:strand:- start:138251 stop:138589 length:339 start_codon:yes stop_codon:yes gene_type:complete